MQATFSHYRILEQIGEGGMGVVYRAHDEGALDRDVAVKVLPPGALADEAARRRFRKEATALSKLNHPNIATVFDFDSDNGTDFLVEELIPGLSLSEMLLAGPLPEREVINLGSQLCEGLAAAHEQGVIHRDLKPANIRVTPDARLKILDFGLAKFMHGRDAGQGVSADATASLTETQTVSGTFPYMAPEQLLNEKLDARADIWAAGCVLYEMATGQRPFLGYGPALIDAILHQQPAPPSKLSHKVRPGLEAIILKCLEKNPALRYASARDIAVDLHRLGTGTVTNALAARRKARALKIGVAVALLLVVGMAAWVWYRAHIRKVGGPKVIAVLYFKNVSQDPSLDWLNGGLTEMLTTNLGQVQGLEVLSSDHIARIRKRLKIKPDQELTAEAAPEVAREAGADAFVTGALMRFGPNRLRADVRLQDASTGRLLFSDKVESADISGIFSMVDAMTARLVDRSAARKELPAATPDIEQVATSNVEAYRHFQAGNDYFNRFLNDKALREYQEAVRLDPQFAMPYVAMARIYWRQAENAKGAQVIAEAERLQNRLPRLRQIEVQAWKSLHVFDYAGGVRNLELMLREAPRDSFTRIKLAQYLDRVVTVPRTESWERAITILREGLALDPKDVGLWNQLALNEAWAGHEAAALQACDRQQALAGLNDAGAWSTRGDVLYQFARDDEAAAAYQKELQLEPEFSEGSDTAMLAVVYADQGKTALADQELRNYQRHASKKTDLVFAAMLQANLLQARGEPEASIPWLHKTVTAALESGQPVGALEWLKYFSRDMPFEELGALDSELAFVRQQKLQGKELQAISFLQARAGREAAAEEALQGFIAADPQVSSAEIERRRAVIRAVVAIRRGNGPAALTALEPYKGLAGLRARAQLLAKDYTGAEHSFKEAISVNRRWGVQTLPIVEHLCRYRLGQTYEGMGRRDDAIREYRSFLSHYSHSRSRLPEIAQARAALKRLGAS